MEMSMRTSTKQAIVLRCQICGKDCSGHAPNCPIGLLEALRQKAWHIECPKCLKDASVDINEQDWFECRLCHTQFTTSGATADSKDAEEVLLFDPVKDWHRSALVMTEKGMGKFPKDKTIEELEKRIAEIEAEKKLTAFQKVAKHPKGALGLLRFFRGALLGNQGEMNGAVEDIIEHYDEIFDEPAQMTILLSEILEGIDIDFDVNL